MAIRTEAWVTFDAVGGALRGLLVEPRTVSPWPAVLVLHPIVGVSPQIKAIAQGFADDGYLALAPDLYTNDLGYREIQVEDIDLAHGGPKSPDWEERMARIRNRAEPPSARPANGSSGAPAATSSRVCTALFATCTTGPTSPASDVSATAWAVSWPAGSRRSASSSPPA